jgi:FtsZ-interacting cell division protein ZipA
VKSLLSGLTPWLLGALAIAGIVVWGLWGRLEAAETKLEAANAVIEQREKDAKANAIAVAQLAQKLTDTETKVITVTEKIYAAPITRECAASPSMRAASDGVRALLSRGQAGDRAKSAAPLRRSRAGAGEPQRQRTGGRAHARRQGLRGLPRPARRSG